MVRSFLVKAFVAAAMVAMSSPAFAATIIDFRNGGASAGGTITYDGTNVFGSNLPIGLVEIFGAPMRNNVYNVDGTVSQPPNVDGDGRVIGDGSYGALNFNTQAGTVSLTGCIPGLGVGIGLNGACNPVTLLSGSTSGFTLTNTAGGTRLDFTGFDTKNPDLLTAIGLSPTTPFVVDAFALLTSTLTAGGTSSSISTDVRNVAVPEPATMMLLGTGLLAAFRARRRQA